MIRRLIVAVGERLIERAGTREPDFIIGGEQRPYLRRWWLLPRNRFFNAYLHQFLRSDDDRAHHSHPWLFRASFILRNSYTEHRILAGGLLTKHILPAGSVSANWGASPHRVELMRSDWNGKPIGPLVPCWTLFVTGPRVREWGFFCMERGFVHWERFTKKDAQGEVGLGCEG